MYYDEIAHWIGSHVAEFLLGLSLVTLILIFLLWRAIETYHHKLWQLGNRGWNTFKSLNYVRRFHRRYPQFYNFFKQRLSPLGYLELYLAIGLLIIGLITFNIFGGIAEQITEEEEIVAFDQRLATTLYENTTPFELNFFRGVTILAGRTATIILGLGVGIILLILRKKLLLLGWAAAILGNSLLNAILKATFQRGRPEFPDPLLIETNWSFPSGHAMGAMVMYGMLTYLLILRFKEGISKIVVMVMVVLVLLIGFSRLYLGVHFFSDVMAGYVVGLGWLTIVISGTEIARRHNWGRPQSPASLKGDQEVVPT